MSLNMIDYLTGPAGGYMTGTHDLITKVYPTRIVQIKSAKNLFPYDIWSRKKGNVGFWLTEGKNGWTDPGSFKINMQYMPLFCPEIIASLPVLTSTYEPTYQTFEKNQWVGDYSGLVDEYVEIHGPYSIDHGGDVGRKDTIFVSYNYNSLADQENYFLVKGFGLVGWQHMVLKNGFYQLATNADGTFQFSFFNKYVALQPLPEPKITFPLSWLP